MMLIVIIVISVCLISIIGYFIFKSTKSNKIVEKGGTLITNGPYNYHVFTQNGNIIFNTSGKVDYLIIGGGGSGGNNHGGGGGAGRVIYGNIDVVAKSYNVIVGNGGIQPINNSTVDCKGKDSSVFDIIAEGGGYGGGDLSGTASSGGSGGGGSGYNAGIINAIIDGGIANGNIGLGNRGGNGNQDKIAGGGGGGGGSGSVGENGFPNVPKPPNYLANGGKGGSGTNKYSEWLSAIKNIMSNEWITATSKGYIAAGGGGGGWVGSEIAIGGEGGGGKGGNQGPGFRTRPFPGVANTGSGGGGGGSNQELGIGGGSGLIVIRYLN